VTDPGPEGCRGVDLDGDGVCDALRADWSRGAPVTPGSPRSDIYGLGAGRDTVASEGIRHTLTWPVDVSGVLLPWDSLSRMLDPGTSDPGLLALQNAARSTLGFGNSEEMYEWLGLVSHDGAEFATGTVRWPDGVEAGQRLGVGRVETPLGPAMTFSCATCHTGELFGRTVFGMTNRKSRANEFFHVAKRFFPSIAPSMFENATDATANEVEQFKRTQKNLPAIGTMPPLVTGLDTSLAQVSLSLARRTPDAWATRDRALERAPSENALATDVADSRPAVWWTVKYKNRWLSDGSIVSGNPIFTNFLWNEIGRGTDLRELDRWLKENQRAVDELTVAVFATEAPKWTDWFGTDGLDLERAQRGKVLFDGECARCHGTYEKGWEQPGGGALRLAEQLATTKVVYFDDTPVKEVGTDPWRARGMAAFADRLNELEISQRAETVVEVQQGYVPPPLDGIWARYPYLHNGSVPTLCDMLLPGPLRTSTFWNGPAHDPQTEFDPDCVGYPRGELVPSAWKDDERAFVDTARTGLSNLGHDEWLVGDDGSPRYSAEERLDLIAFLKTL
jgi:mono/diheme cytochrome c family protein